MWRDPKEPLAPSDSLCHFGILRWSEWGLAMRDAGRHRHHVDHVRLVYARTCILLVSSIVVLMNSHVSLIIRLRLLRAGPSSRFGVALDDNANQYHAVWADERMWLRLPQNATPIAWPRQVSYYAVKSLGQFIGCFMYADICKRDCKRAGI